MPPHPVLAHESEAAVNDILVMNYLWILAWAVIILVALHLRAKRRERRLEMLHKERIVAMEKGVPIPELNGEHWQARVNPRWPLGIGAILTLIGCSLQQHWSLGIIWVFAGLGFVAYYYLTSERK
jgi:hypothetical protein